MRSSVAVLFFAVTACTGKTSEGSHPGAGSDGGVHADSGTPADAQSGDASASDDAGDCGQPSQVEYSCPNGPSDGGLCARYGGPGDLAPQDAGFALGCMVTLPMCNGYYDVPQTCNCEDFPGNGGPRWICPL